MIPLAAVPLEDVQGQVDPRAVAIDEVGISDLRYPIRVAGRGGVAQASVATISATVDLPADVRGTHMSRFVQALGEHLAVLDQRAGAALAEHLLDRLNSSRASADPGVSVLRRAVRSRKRPPRHGGRGGAAECGG